MGTNQNPNYWEAQKIRATLRKFELVKSLGGCCSKCGYNKNLAALEFHHIDASKKSFQLDARKIANTNKKKLAEEVAKCQLLCSNCHKELHYDHLIIKELPKRLENKIKVYKSILSSSTPKRKTKNCEHCQKNYFPNKGKRFCSEQCRHDNKGYPTFQEISDKYNELKSWEKVADYFGITRRITQYIRRRHKKINKMK